MSGWDGMSKSDRIDHSPNGSANRVVRNSVDS